jgi:1,2-diacylglycerol 3-beta-glucosyltransferase
VISGIAFGSISPVAHALVTAGLVAVGCVFATPALYLLIVSVAAVFHSERSLEALPSTQVAVLIPAHNESQLIARCVRSLRAQSYPDDLCKIVVVADNCTDDTAKVAAAAGADLVMTRDAPTARGKGQALRWALDRILSWESAPGAVVIVDADAIPAPNLVANLVRRSQAGAGAVQGMYLLSDADARGASLGTIAFMLVNRVRPAGLTVLRLPGIHLNGNGMLLSREVLERNPWTAFTSTEDLEYSLTLRIAGENIVFASDAVLLAPPAPNDDAAAAQRLRWHGGRIHLARVWTVRLTARAIAERRPSLVAVALGLAVPPLGLLAAALLIGSAVAILLIVTGVASVWGLLPWLLALASIPTSVVIGLRAAHAPASQYATLLRAPMYIFRMALGALDVLRFRADSWVRTQREAK